MYGKDFDPRAAEAAKMTPAPGEGTQSLQGILDRLVAVSPLQGYPVRAVLLPDPQINAFTDGRRIFLTTGLVTVFQDRPDLIASVLAHELGHILGRHIPDSKSRVIMLEYLSYLTPALSALPYGGLYGQAAGTVVREGAKIRRFSYSRLQENEADAIGVFLAGEAGYQGIGLCGFFDAVTDSGWGRPRQFAVPVSVGAVPESALVTLLSTSPLYRVHPPSEKRKPWVELMAQRQRGEISGEELGEKSKWLERLYSTLKKRQPK